MSFSRHFANIGSALVIFLYFFSLGPTQAIHGHHGEMDTAEAPVTVETVVEEEHFSTEAKLIYNLLRAYRTQVRPTNSSKNTTNVKVSMNLKQIIDLNEKKGELTTSLYMFYTWNDARLKWNISLYDDIERIRIPSTTIWTPDIILTNTVDENMRNSIVVNAVVYHTGLVEWLPLSIFKTSCSIKVVHFPFDQQACSLIFKSAGYDQSQMRLALYGKNESFGNVSIDDNEFVPHGEWALVDRPAEVYRPKSKREPNEVIFTFVTKRKPLFYTLNMLLPCMLLTVLSCFTFYLPSASCEKISLGISLLIGDTIFIFLFAQRMPSTSFSIPLIAAYLLYTMCLLSVCVITSTFVLSIHWRSNSSHKMPSWMREFVFVYLKSYAGMSKMNHGRNILYTGRAYRDNPNSYDKTNGFSSIKSNRAKQERLGSDAFFSHEARRFGLTARKLDAKSKEGSSKKISTMPSVSFTSDVPTIFQDSYDKIHTISHLLKKDREDQMGQDEWGQIAEVLDRALMWFYLFFFGFGTLSFYIYVMILQQ